MIPEMGRSRPIATADLDPNQALRWAVLVSDRHSYTDGALAMVKLCEYAPMGLEKTGLAAGRAFRVLRRSTGHLLQVAATGGCLMAALAAGANRNPILFGIMMLAAAYCALRLVADIRAAEASAAGPGVQPGAPGRQSSGSERGR